VAVQFVNDIASYKSGTAGYDVHYGAPSPSRLSDGLEISVHQLRLLEDFTNRTY
jgi:hypothetical protein